MGRVPAQTFSEAKKGGPVQVGESYCKVRSQVKHKDEGMTGRCEERNFANEERMCLSEKVSAIVCII
jgi:hypothetical protein